MASLNKLKDLVLLGLSNALDRNAEDSRAEMMTRELAKLTGLTNLTSLDVSGNSLRDPLSRIGPLRPYKHLRHLDISTCSSGE